jgi:asparagine synthase (glutamine-hydrolysing)
MLTTCIALWNADGQVQFRVHQPKAAAGRPPLATIAHDKQSQVAALLVGGLLYREDLDARFLEAAASGDNASDAALAVAAYRLGGRPALERLEGEFALMLWDCARQRLLALRDPLGSWPLFWLAQCSSVAISTSLEALVRLQPGRSFDEGYLAEFLMWPNPHAELPSERTAFEKVRRVLAGTVVEFGPGSQARQQRYWDWESRLQHVVGITQEEAGETVALLFRQAVRQRLRRGPVAAHLSGGMDSSAVTCVARDVLSSSGGSPLVTLSLVYQRSSLAGERPYIDLVLKQGGAVTPHFLNGEMAPDYEWFRTGVPFHEEPYAGLPGAGMNQLLVEAANRLEVATVLSGLGSDEIFASSPSHIADLLQQGRYLAAFGEARTWSRALNCGFWTIFRRYGLELSWPRLWGERGSWPRLGWFSIPPWIGEDFARKQWMAERGRQHARRLCDGPVSRALQRNMLETGAGDWARWNLAEPRGLNLSHPFQDPRLICYALGLPRQFRSVPGERKPVLQTALRGILPEEICIRRDKRGFDDIYGFGLARNLEYLEQMAQVSPLQQLGILDAEKLIPVMRDVALGIGDIRARERMDKTLALVAWFDQFQRGLPEEVRVEKCLVIDGKGCERRRVEAHCV